MKGEDKMKVIEEKYGVDFGVNGDKPLHEFLTERGYPSLAKLLSTKDGRQVHRKSRKIRV